MNKTLLDDQKYHNMEDSAIARFGGSGALVRFWAWISRGCGGRETTGNNKQDFETESANELFYM